MKNKYNKGLLCLFSLIYIVFIVCVFCSCGSIKINKIESNDISQNSNAKSKNELYKNEKSLILEKQSKTEEIELIDSIYPEEYIDTKGMEFYRKVMKGIYVYSKSYSGVAYNDEITRLDFFNEQGNKINEYNALTNNPYNKQSIPTLIRGNYEAYVYDSYVDKSDTEGKIEFLPTEYYTFTRISSSEGLPIVGYNLLGLKDNQVVDWKFTAVCFDEKGSILKVFKDLDIDANNFCVSENKKFFCVTYGGLKGEDLTQLRKSGFRIYDIVTGELVYELNVDGNHYIVGPGSDNKGKGFDTGIISISGNDFSKEEIRKIIFINFNHRILYSRLFKYDEQENILDRDFEGLKMYDAVNHRRWKLYFDKDFIASKF